VTVERDRDGVRLAVSDRGPGIPQSEQSRVFGRFYRLEQSRSTPGNGLGLSLVQAVAQLHRATISLRSIDPGLRVELQFPLLDGATSEQRPLGAGATWLAPAQPSGTTSP